MKIGSSSPSLDQNTELSQTPSLAQADLTNINQQIDGKIGNILDGYSSSQQNMLKGALAKECFGVNNARANCTKN